LRRGFAGKDEHPQIGKPNLKGGYIFFLEKKGQPAIIGGEPGTKRVGTDLRGIGEGPRSSVEYNLVGLIKRSLVKLEEWWPFCGRQ